MIKDKPNRDLVRRSCDGELRIELATPGAGDREWNTILDGAMYFLNFESELSAEVEEIRPVGMKPILLEDEYDIGEASMEVYATVGNITKIKSMALLEGKTRRFNIYVTHYQKGDTAGGLANTGVPREVIKYCDCQFTVLPSSKLDNTKNGLATEQVTFKFESRELISDFHGLAK